MLELKFLKDIGFLDSDENEAVVTNKKGEEFSLIEVLHAHSYILRNNSYHSKDQEGFASKTRVTINGEWRLINP